MMLTSKIFTSKDDNVQHVYAQNVNYVWTKTWLAKGVKIFQVDFPHLLTRQTIVYVE